MDKTSITPDRETAYQILSYMQSAMKKNGVNPCHIALFGSFLHGNNHPESDLDVIVISEAFKGKDDDQRIFMTIKAEDEVRKRNVVPMDILTKTPEEYEKTCLESKIII